MGQHLNSGMAIRFVAIAVVTLTIAATVMQVRRRDEFAAASSTSARAMPDPLRAELIRCQALGEAGARDDDCLHAWAESRRRFLRPDRQVEEPFLVGPADPNPPTASLKDQHRLGEDHSPTSKRRSE